MNNTQRTGGKEPEDAGKMMDLRPFAIARIFRNRVGVSKLANEQNALSKEFWDRYALGELFGDTPLSRTLQFLLVHRNWDYSLKEIAKQTHLGSRTFYRHIPKLTALDVLQVSRRIGATRLYRLNEKSPIVPLLDKLLLEIGYKLVELEKPETHSNPSTQQGLNELTNVQ